MDPKLSNSPDANAQRAAYDEFSKAFTEIEGEETPSTRPDDEPAVAVASAPAPEPAAQPAEPAVAAPSAPETPAAVEEPPPAESAVVAEADAGEQARLTALEAKIAELSRPSMPAPPSSSPSAEPAAPVEPVWYQFSDEEKATLETYDKDWGDMAKAETIRRKADIFNAVAYVFAQVKQHIEPRLKEFSEISEVMSNQLALQELRRENQDYDNIYDAVTTWVDTLPVPFRAGAKQVMESGTTEEVNALIKEYKKSHSAAPASAPSAAVPAAPTGRQGTANLSPAAKQAAQRLSVVGSKRSTQRGSAVDPNDFDGAWDEAMRESNA